MKFNSLIPELSVSDIEKSKLFYLGVLGFKIEYDRQENKFIFISYGDAQIMLEQRNGYWETDMMVPPFGRGINFQIAADDVEQLREKLLCNGIRLFQDIEEVSYREGGILHKMKELLVQDPDGYLLRFSQLL